MIIFLGNDKATKLYSDFVKATEKDKPDMVVSCQYPHKIPESLINSHICINIHYGKLPEYAGCNPVYWQILFDHTAGVTIHYVDKYFDSGDIISCVTVPIGAMTAEELYNSLARVGAAKFTELYKSILKGSCKRQPQEFKRRKYYTSDSVSFKQKLCCLNDRKIRALSFPEYQYPLVECGERTYKLVACEQREKGGGDESI